MDKFDKAINIGLTSVFVTTGTGAMIGAIFFGATHQFAVAAICALMMWLQLVELIQAHKKSKQTN